MIDRISRFQPLLFAISLFGYVGCEKADRFSEPEVSLDGKRVFEVKGVVQEVRQQGKILVIDHEEIPGFMRQMIMPFQVVESEIASGENLKPGEEISFRYEVEQVKSRISKIQKTGRTGAIKLSDPEDIADSTDHPLLSIGDELPDYKFLDQDARPVKLSDYRGMPVALTFVFSRCPVPEYCPAMMRNFDQIEEALKQDPTSPVKWKLLSISFDTKNETPASMKNYGEAFGRDSENWSLLSTDHCCTINEFAGNVGLKFADKDGSFIHNLRTVILDKDGKIARIFTDETWTIEDLIAELKRVG